MYRITQVIDLADPAACLPGQPVSRVHLVRHPEGGMFAVITFANHQAALIPRGRLGLEDAEGMRALESFRRWLKQQDVPLSRALLGCAVPQAYEIIESTRSFAVSGMCDAPLDNELVSRFQEWVASKPMTPARGNPRLTA